jgi:hypothetical protein
LGVPVESSICRAYVSSVRLVDGVQMKLVPVCPEAMTSTVFKTFAGPFFRVRVTGPDAPVQVMFKGVPALTPTNDCGVLVIWTALTRAMAAAATTANENCILKYLGSLRNSNEGGLSTAARTRISRRSGTEGKQCATE